jgi:hypothetical protein
MAVQIFLKIIMSEYSLEMELQVYSAVGTCAVMCHM